MIYLNESDIEPYLNAGKEIEQYLGEFLISDHRCFRYLVLGKEKSGYYGLLFEKFDDSNEGLDSIYDFSSVEPDELYGRELGAFETLDLLIEQINKAILLDPTKYLLSGHLNQIINNKPNKL